MAKSIVSLAIGCAIDDGFIRDVDQPVSDFFPEFKGYDGKALTLRHLLTMSAGVDFDEAYSSPFSPTTQLYYGDDLQEIAFGMKEIDEPGVNFIYQSGVTQLLGFIVEKATGEKVNYKIVGRRTGDIEKVWADTTLANQELGWKAEVPIEETLANAWKWQQALMKK